MVFVSYFATFFLLFVLPAQVYPGYIISLYDDVKKDFKFVKQESSMQDMQGIRVFIYVYKNEITQICMKVVSFNLLKTQDPLDFIMVSCDVVGPFKMAGSMINVADVGRLGIEKDFPIWGVYVLPTGSFIQRRYTDHDWNFLGEIEEVELTGEQYKKVLQSGKPFKAVRPAPPPKPAPKLPALGEHKAKIISPNNVPGYRQDDSKEDIDAVGDFVKLTVTYKKHMTTGACARLVVLESVKTDDLLDSIVMSCDNEREAPVIAEDMVSYAGLIYVRDHKNDPIWAILVINDDESFHCILRVYTDKEKQFLQPDNDNKLTQEECRTILETKDIDGHWTNEIEDDKSNDSHPHQELIDEIWEFIRSEREKKAALNSQTPSQHEPEGSKPPSDFQPVPEPKPPAPLQEQPVNQQPAGGISILGKIKGPQTTPQDEDTGRIIGPEIGPSLQSERKVPPPPPLRPSTRGPTDVAGPASSQNGQQAPPQAACRGLDDSQCRGLDDSQFGRTTKSGPFSFSFKTLSQKVTKGFEKLEEKSQVYVN